MTTTKTDNPQSEKFSKITDLAQIFDADDYSIEMSKGRVSFYGQDFKLKNYNPIYSNGTHSIIYGQSWNNMRRLQHSNFNDVIEDVVEVGSNGLSQFRRDVENNDFFIVLHPGKDLKGFIVDTNEMRISSSADVVGENNVDAHETIRIALGGVFFIESNDGVLSINSSTDAKKILEFMSRRT